MAVTEKNRGILARTIWGEARDENVVSQIAIAWTIRNWLFDGRPKSWWRRICQRLPGAVPVQLLEQNRSDRLCNRSRSTSGVPRLRRWA